MLKWGWNQYWPCKYNTIIGNHNDIQLNVLLKIASFAIHLKHKKHKDVFHWTAYFKDNPATTKKCFYHQTATAYIMIPYNLASIFPLMFKGYSSQCSFSKTSPNQNNSRSPQGGEGSVWETKPGWTYFTKWDGHPFS